MQELSEISNVTGNKTAQPLANSSRIVWLEYLTISAAFAVVWLHVSADAIENASNNYTWWVSNIADAMVRWPVPVFVMISGYFLLDPSRDYTLISFYKKRAARILAPLIFWSVFYIAFSVIQKYLADQPLGLRNFIGPILIGRPSYHLWYLYMLVGMYLAAPFIRRIVSSSNKNELIFLCVGSFIFSVLAETANVFYYGIYDTVTNGSLFLTWFLSFIGYYLAGHLLGRITDIKIGLFTLIGVLIVAISLTAVGFGFVTTRHSLELGQYFYHPLSPTVVVMAITIFLLAKKLLPKAPKIKLAGSAAASMLGVYVMHPFFIACLGYLGLDVMKFNPIIGIPLVTFCVFIICLIVAEAIKRVPYFNRVI